jgi:hypothetical protein
VRKGALHGRGSGLGLPGLFEIRGFGMRLWGAVAAGGVECEVWTGLLLTPFPAEDVAVARGESARESGWCGGERLCLKVAAIQRGRQLGAQGLAHLHLRQSLFPSQNTYSVLNM